MVDVSNVAAYSLQAGMTMRELERLFKTLGKQPDKQTMRQIGAIRSQLRGTAKELRVR